MWMLLRWMVGTVSSAFGVYSQTVTGSMRTVLENLKKSDNVEKRFISLSNRGAPTGVTYAVFFSAIASRQC